MSSIDNLPLEIQNKICYYYAEHPCAEMIKEYNEDKDEYEDRKPYKYRKFMPIRYDDIMGFSLLLVCRHSCLTISRLLELLDDEIDNLTKHDKRLMYGLLLNYTDKDGLIRWYSNGESLQERVFTNMFPNRDDNDDYREYENYYDSHSDDSDDDDSSDEDDSDDDDDYR